MPDRKIIINRSGLLRSSRGERVDPSGRHSVTQRTLRDANWSPWLVESEDPACELVEWSYPHRAALNERLRKHGAILFRGFANGEAIFRRFVSEYIPEIMAYREGATPRTALGNGVYTSTEFPSDQQIHLHNELSYINDWPMRLAFGCIAPSAIGGATPLADMRRVLNRMSPAVRSQFESRGWCLVRNYGNGLGPAWKRSFGVESLDAVAEYCAAADIELEILGAESIRTRQTRPAIHRHPLTDELIWFNHVAFWHPSSLPSTIRAGLGLNDDELPFNTLWGDGEPIKEAILAEIRDAIDAETMKFPWRTGDILLIDNMLVAHGREPYEGQRKVLASMGQPVSGYPKSVSWTERES